MSTSVLPSVVREVVRAIDSWLSGGEFSSVDPSMCRKIEATDDGSIEIRYAITIGKFPAWIVISLPASQTPTVESVGWICSLEDGPGEAVSAWIDKQEKSFADGRRFYVDERLRVMMSRTLVVDKDAPAKIKEILDEYFFALGILWMDLLHVAKIRVKLPFDEE